MANKEIINLPLVTELTGDTRIPVYQPGAAQKAQSMTGEQLKEFSRSGFREEYQEAIDHVQAEGRDQVASVTAAGVQFTAIGLSVDAEGYVIQTIDESEV